MYFCQKNLNQEVLTETVWSYNLLIRGCVAAAGHQWAGHRPTPAGPEDAGHGGETFCTCPFQRPRLLQGITLSPVYESGMAGRKKGAARNLPQQTKFTCPPLRSRLRRTAWCASALWYQMGTACATTPWRITSTLPCHHSTSVQKQMPLIWLRQWKMPFWTWEEFWNKVPSPNCEDPQTEPYLLCWFEVLEWDHGSWGSHCTLRPNRSTIIFTDIRLVKISGNHQSRLFHLVLINFSVHDV